MKYNINDLLDIMKRLRAEDGCAWDRAQTHQSIKRSMIEEAYEAIEALDNNDDKLFANELGDVLLQVVFHARIAEERGAFDFNDVVGEICTKLIERHTHVFGEDKAENASEALDAWEKNKKKEKGLKSYSDTLRDVPVDFPALIRAEKVQKKAKAAGLNIADRNELVGEIKERLDILKSADIEKNRNEIDELFGELLFSVVNLGRTLKADSEICLKDATKRFINDFSDMEEEAAKNQIDLEALSGEEIYDMWKRNKIK